MNEGFLSFLFLINNKLQKFKKEKKNVFHIVIVIMGLGLSRIV